MDFWGNCSYHLNQLQRGHFKPNVCLSIHLSNAHMYIHPPIKCTDVYTSTYQMYTRTYIHLSNVHTYIHPPIKCTRVHTSTCQMHTRTYIHLSHAHAYVHPPITCTRIRTYTYQTHTSIHPLSVYIVGRCYLQGNQNVSVLSIKNREF